MTSGIKRMSAQSLGPDDRVAEALRLGKPAVFKIVNPDVGWVEKLHAASPDTVLIGRILNEYTDKHLKHKLSDTAGNHDLEAEGRAFADGVFAKAEEVRHVKWWEGSNEAAHGAEGIERLCRFEKAFAERLQSRGRGYHALVGGFSTGHPNPEHWQLFYPAMKVAHGIHFHEYWKPGAEGTQVDSQDILRYVDWWGTLPDWKDSKWWLVSELGFVRFDPKERGWSGWMEPSAYLELLKGYAQAMANHPLFAATIYIAGLDIPPESREKWRTFDICGGGDPKDGLKEGTVLKDLSTQWAAAPVGKKWGSPVPANLDEQDTAPIDTPAEELPAPPWEQAAQTAWRGVIVPHNPDFGFPKKAVQVLGAEAFALSDENRYQVGGTKWVAQLWSDGTQVKMLLTVEGQWQPEDIQLVGVAEQPQPWERAARTAWQGVIVPHNPDSGFPRKGVQVLGAEAFALSDEKPHEVGGTKWVAQLWSDGTQVKMLLTVEGQWQPEDIQLVGVAGQPQPGHAPDTTPAATAPVASIARPSNMIQMKDGHFWLHGDRLRFIGVNTRGLVHYGHKQTLRYSDKGHRDVQLKFAQEMGARVVRVFLANRHRESKDIGQCLQDTLDKLRGRDMYVIIAFTNVYEDTPFSVKRDDEYYTVQVQAPKTKMLNALFFGSGYTKNYLPFVEYIVRRFKDHPSIFAWELGNELKAQNDARQPDPGLFAEFAHKVAGEIRALDPNHLITTGIINTGNLGMKEEQAVSLYRDVNLDFLTVHLYPDTPGSPEHDRALTELEIAEEVGKPLVIEEIGFERDRVRKTEEAMTTWFNKGAKGYMQWGFMATDHNNGDGHPLLGMYRCENLTFTASDGKTKRHQDFEDLSKVYSRQAGILASRIS